MATIGERTQKPITCASCRKPFTPSNPRFTTCYDCHQKHRLGEVAPAFPKGYLEKGYFSNAEKGVVYPDLLTGDADVIARALAEADVSMAQLRRYFNMARFLQNRLESGEDYEVIANQLRRMKANVAAVVGRIQDSRERDRLARTLKTFIDKNLDAAVQSCLSFKKGFLLHFECVLSYFYWHKSQMGGGRRGA